MTEPNFVSGTVWTGDNLPVLRGINSECVDLIYLDPPFNSNRNYEAPIGSKAAGAAFKDMWTLDDVDVHEHGELADRNPAAYSVIEAARQAHGKGMMSYLIFMAVRLIELRRILKPTGSIYLHCDDTAGHYLKLLMDGVFGRLNCRNTIIWKRQSGNNAGNNFGRIADWLLWYTKSDAFIWNIPYGKLSPEQAKRYRYKEQFTGRFYAKEDLTAPSTDPARKFTWRGTTPGGSRGWAYSHERLEELWNAGLIHTKTDGKPALDGRKKYLDQHPGAKVQNIWTDIQRVGNTAKERVGYPTQKPLALLDRIIKTSSNKNDFILDPFCGCATALVAADRLGRKWAGIDLSELAVKLVNDRINSDRAVHEKSFGKHIGGNLFGGAIALTNAPKRSDLGNIPNYRTHRHRLYGEQEGICAGCSTHFPFKVMEVDHILPRSKGGTDHIDNLQLLCTACNKSKGSKTMAQWRALP
ncbi:MAG: DNA methyltransferase [Aestuariivita sp.]|nr:DNA methyltransferase [Aestuariivita sp.]